MALIKEMIPADTFDNIQNGAGMLLWNFDPTKPGNVTPEDVICATTGGVTVSCKATYSDLAEDVDNCQNGMLEFQNIDGWECSISTTSLAANAESIQFALGAADVEDADGYKKIIPRRSMKVSDAKDIWWVGPKMNGGAVAACLKNALSSEGFSLQTQKNGKGQTAITIMGHPTVATQNEVPMEYYVFPPKTEAGGDQEVAL